jgi:hypothetical protein
VTTIETDKTDTKPMTAKRSPELGLKDLPKVPDYSGTEARHETVDHPAHYGGAEDPFEAIKVIEAWGLGFQTGNAVKYIARAGRKPDTEYLEDLRKAAWYLQREIERVAES